MTDEYPSDTYYDRDNSGFGLSDCVYQRKILKMIRLRRKRAERFYAAKFKIVANQHDGGRLKEDKKVV